MRYVWLGIGGGLLLLALGLGGWFWMTQTSEYARGCETETFTVNGSSLAPLVSEGTEVTAAKTSCASVQKGDLAVFETPKNDNPVIKRVAAVPGDTFKVKDDGMLVVNGEPAQTPEQKPYKATQQTRDMFALYEGELDGYLLLGKPGSLDSGQIGAIGTDSITHVVSQSQL